MNNPKIIKFAKFFCFSLTIFIVKAQAECNTTVGATSSSEHFVDLGNGTVEDKRTGLVWSKCSAGSVWRSESGRCEEQARGVSEFLWQDALIYASNLNVQADSDWRLPNKKELASIVEYACFAPAINQEFFPQTHSSNYWTATPLPYTQPLKVVAVDFSSGAFNSFNAATTMAKVRLVYSK